MTIPPRPSSTGSEAANTLAAVLEDQKQRADRRDRKPPPPRDRRPLMLGVAVVLLGLATWILIAPPAFLRPAPVPEPAAQVLEAGVRLEVFAAATSIRQYADSTGRLPAQLADAWPRATEGVVTFRALPDGSFEVVGQGDGAPIRYHSSEPVATLLEGARATLDPRDP